MANHCFLWWWGGGGCTKEKCYMSDFGRKCFSVNVKTLGKHFFPLCKKTETKCNFTVCHISYLLGLAYLKQMINFKQHWFDTLYFWFILNEQIRFLNWEREEETQPLNIMKGNICLSYKSWQQTKHILNCGNCSK